MACNFTWRAMSHARNNCWYAGSHKCILAAGHKGRCVCKCGAFPSVSKNMRYKRTPEKKK
jgi:hypothetical protein